MVVGELLLVKEGDSGRSSGKGSLISVTEGRGIVVRHLSLKSPHCFGLVDLDLDRWSNLDNCSCGPFRTEGRGGDEGGVICPCVIQSVRLSGKRPRRAAMSMFVGGLD